MLIKINQIKKYSYRISKHSPNVGSKCQKSTHLKYYHIHSAIERVGAWKKDHFHHNKFGVKNKKPCQYRAYNATYVPYTPQHSSAAFVVEINLFPKRLIFVLHHGKVARTNPIQWLRWPTLRMVKSKAMVSTYSKSKQFRKVFDTNNMLR